MTTTAFEALTSELESLLEDGATIQPGQAMWHHGGSADPSKSYRDSLPIGDGPGERRCPNGQRKDPNTGKCVPREQLKTQYRGHEPLAAMHREKHLAHATAAQQFRAAGDHTRADKHEKLAKRHLGAAQFHNAQFHAIGKALYPQRYAKMAQKHAGQQIQQHGTRALEFPAFQKPPSPGRFGGQAWGGKPGTPAPSSKPTPRPGAHPDYNPFGKPKPPEHVNPAAAPPPEHHAAPSPAAAPAAPHNGGAAPVAPAQKPSILHKIGNAAISGLSQAAAQKAHHTGGLGWSALSHALTHLTGGGTAATAPTTPQAQATPAHDPATHHAAMQHHMGMSAHHASLAKKAANAGDTNAAQQHWMLANQHGEHANRHNAALQAAGHGPTTPNPAVGHGPTAPAPLPPKKKKKPAPTGSSATPRTRPSFSTGI